MDAHSADAPGGSMAPTSSATTIDADSGFSPDPLRGSSDKLRIANTKWARFSRFFIHFCHWLIGLLSPKEKKEMAAESGITGILQETARHDGNEEDNRVLTADSPRQPNSIHNEGGDQDDPDLNADAAGQEDPPEARNHRAGDVQVAPVNDTVLQILVDLPTPKQNWIYPELKIV